MFTKSTRLNTLLSFAFLFAIASCGDLGGGCGCSMQPLPPGGLPKDQTVEGGGQIRVTQAGFQKLTSIIPAVLNDAFADGFCVERGSVGSPTGFLGTGAYYCDAIGPINGRDWNCPGSSTGCQVDVHTDFVSITVPNNQRLRIRAQIDLQTIARLNGQIVGIGFGCNMSVTANNLLVDASIAFSIDPATGELRINLASINDISIPSNVLGGCSVLSDLGNLVLDILDSFVGQLILDLLTPTLNDLIQGFLPDPLGIAGMMDVGEMVGGISPGTEALMEVRMVPGGYVQLSGGGMSLGLITGLNADEDPSTRAPDLDSEPHLCVPPMLAPNFAAPPHSLPVSSRGTFTLLPANEFLGMPEPADDLAIGISETTLDLAGHHVVTSGMMCLGVGTNLIAQLNLGTFSLLVPSLATLGDATNPVLMVTRPQKALDFAIGAGTATDPALTITIDDFEVDIYVFIYERYVRAFTMKLDLAIGLNLEFDQQPGMPATVTPVLLGLSSNNIQVSVLNNEFVRETADQLEGVLPTIFDLALGLLGGGLGPIEVPSFAGFTLNNLRVQKVTTSEDDFMAIYASLGSSTMLRDLATRFPSVDALLDSHFADPAYGAPVDAPAPRLVSVRTPAISEVRLALQGRPEADLPSVTIAVPTHDAAGRPLEHQWMLGGAWRPWTAATAAGHLIVTDRAFAWQGKYTVHVRSRVVGDYTTTSDVTELPVIVDSVPPEILVAEARLTGDKLVVPARDLVSPTPALRWAFGRPGAATGADGRPEPWTEWQASPELARATVEDLAVDGAILVFVQDEAGNVGHSIVPVPFHGQAGEGGCSCDAGGGAPAPGTIALMLLTVGIFLRRRVVALARAAAGRPAVRRAARLGALWLALGTAASLVPGCSCGGDPGVQYCEVTEDCTIECPNGEIPFCLDRTCVCIDDVPYGRIGPYSSVATDSTGNAWVAAYAESHGDLVVGMWETAGRIPNQRWEFVDGVPDGPVAVPESDVRGGILAKGPNVGKYTSIAVGNGDVPMVTYYDVDKGSLKFAAKYGGVWQIHTVDDGTGDIDPELGGEIAGLYSSLTLRSDNGNPGVAYMAVVSEGGGVTRTEVRFAAAQNANPSSPGDWVSWVVDSLTLPPDVMDTTPLPLGLGLFVDATRDAAQAPVLAYYDRTNGDLKLARLDAGTGAFTVERLDGATSDVGWYPSVAVDAEGVAHVSYQSATRDDLMYVNTSNRTPVIVDDGYRIVGTTEDGLPKPEFHFVGEDSNILLVSTGPVIVYQDTTSHELLYAAYNATTGIWQRRAIAGDEAEFAGAYGFFASAVSSGQDIVVSNWVINQRRSDQWVEIHRERVVVE